VSDTPTIADVFAPAPAVRAGLRAAGYGAIAMVVLFLGMLWLPIAASILRLHVLGAPDEKRTLATAPGWPHTWTNLLAFPGALGRLADDRFGFRAELVWLNGRLRYRLFGELDSDQVLFGRHGRLFLTSHVKGQPFSLIDEACGVRTGPAQIAQAAARLAAVLAEAQRLARRSAFIAIPTAAVLYPDDLQPWLAARCRSFRPIVPAIRDVLAARWPALSGRLLYPIEAMRAAMAVGDPIPLTNFHWSGLAAKRAVETVAEGPLGMTRRREIALGTTTEGSDLAGFTPGLRLRNRVEAPVYRGSGVRACSGVACAAELAPFAAGLNEVSRFRWESGDGPTLLLISDSFGVRAAEYFGEYFADVIHLNIAYDRLDAEHLRRLRGVLFDKFRPDTLLFLFHDGGVRGGTGAVGAGLLQ